MENVIDATDWQIRVDLIKAHFNNGSIDNNLNLIWYRIHELFDYFKIRNQTENHSVIQGCVHLLSPDNSGEDDDCSLSKVNSYRNLFNTSKVFLYNSYTSNYFNSFNSSIVNHVSKKI